MSYRLYPAIGVLCLAACGRTFPASPSGTAPQPASDSQAEPRRARITVLPGTTLVPDSELRRYLTTSTTTVQLGPEGDSNQSVIKMTLGFDVAYSRVLPLRTAITGTITQMSLTATGFSQVPDQEPDLPLEFTGYVESGGLYLDSVARSPVGTVVDCQTAGLNLMNTLQRSVVIPPLVLSSGTTWTDSSTVPACSGSIQLALTTIRTYTVAGQATRGVHPVIMVDRQDRVRTMGEGAQGQHRITLSSQGSGSARLYLDRATGFLQESESTQAVDIIIGSSGRSQRFRQVVDEQTRLQQ